MTVKLFEPHYRDDLIFMVLEAKDALGRVPGLNEDLLDIRTNYFDRGDAFFIATDENDRVVGCAGFSRIKNTNEAFVHRLYVKASLKRRGIGTRLLQTVEDAMRASGVTLSRVHLGEPREQWFESWAFYPKHGYREYAPGYMAKEL